MKMRSASVIPSASKVSSRDLGWRALLVELHTGIAPNTNDHPYQSIGTPDQVIGIATRGRYASEAYYSGRWRRGIYQPGSICLHTRNESTRYRFNARDYGNASTALVYIPESLILTAAEHYKHLGHAWVEPTFQLCVERDSALYHMTQSLLLAIERGLDDLYAECAAAWLAVHLVTNYNPTLKSDERRHAGQLVDARLSRVIEYMTHKYAEAITLDQLAAEACVSKYHFVRMFRDKVGKTPHSYLTEIRLDCARQMLLATYLSVSEIAASCGFSRPSHFSVAFTARYGVSPSNYRVQRRPSRTLASTTAQR